MHTRKTSYANTCGITMNFPNSIHDFPYLSSVGSSGTYSHEQASVKFHYIAHFRYLNSVSVAVKENIVYYFVRVEVRGAFKF